MVQGEQEHVLLAAEPHDPRAQQRPAAQVERSAPLLGGEPAQAGLALGLGDRREVDLGQRDGQGGADHLQGLSIGLGKGRPQDLVTPDDLAQHPGEQGLVERALDADDLRQIVGGAPGVQPVQEPEALLSEREGSRTARGSAARNAAPPRRRSLPSQSLFQQFLFYI